jgi:hypothetical protein
MTPKEKLIQAIERSPDEIVQKLLEVLPELQRQQSLEAKETQLDSRKTVLERMGGVPKHLLSVGNLSDRDRRRALIADYLQQKYQQDS